MVTQGEEAKAQLFPSTSTALFLYMVRLGVKKKNLKIAIQSK